MAESVESFFLRIKSFFDEQFSKNENVLIVAHGGYRFTIDMSH